MGNIFKRKPSPDIFRITTEEHLPLLDQNLLLKRRDPQNLIKIGRNVFMKRLTDQYMIKRQTREFLERYYIRFEKKDNGVKIGIEGDIVAPQQFVQTFVSCLVESQMSGYIFIGIKLPLLKQLVKVDYTNLRRIQIVKSNIDNIQPISWINSDKFQTIYFSRNNITNIHALAKTRFPNFVSIQLDENFITNFRPLTRALMTIYNPQKKNKFFVFMTFESFQNSDLSFILKAQNTEMCVVGEKSRAVNLIKNEKVFDAIRKLQTHVQLPRRQLARR